MSRKAVLKLCICFLALPHALVSKIPEELTQDFFDQGITIDLREPSYEDGVLVTEQGGVITAPNIRIQAQHITYIRKTNEEGNKILRLEAEGDLMVEYHQHLFVGKSLTYDFLSKEGVILCGKTSSPPWYFGGEQIDLKADGCYRIHEAFITTSENYQAEWEITADEALIRRNCLLDAKNVHFKFVKLPLFWLPSFKTDLTSIFDSPIRYSARIGGSDGPRVSMSYEITRSPYFRNFLRLDWRLERGLGGGFETRWRTPSGNTQFRSINYMANDSTRTSTRDRTRYRFQGILNSCFGDDPISIRLAYDKLSDRDMAADYNDRDLVIHAARRTELHLRKQHTRWIANFWLRPRINDFQMVNQELPTLRWTLHPIELWRNGWIAETYFQGSYLDFEYADEYPELRDYCSPRFELRSRSYRTYPIGIFTFTPEIGGISIYYGNSPGGGEQWLNSGIFGGRFSSRATRLYGSQKHVIEPYVSYYYVTSPSSAPDEHYIFTIDDGWDRLNQYRWGIEQSVYTYDSCYGFRRQLWFDLYSFAFLDSSIFPATVPKAYAQIQYSPTAFLTHTIHSGWDFAYGELDHFNLRTDWTFSDDLAFAAEYRHRSPYAWRKAQPDNFFLDAFRPPRELLHSDVSDRRDTFLLQLFYRFYPTWAMKFTSRQGWNRKTQPRYNEYQIDFEGTLRSAWNVRISYQSREDDKRFGVYFNLGLKCPNTTTECACPPLLNF